MGHRLVDFFGVGAFFEHEFALAAIGCVDAVADEAFADTRDDSGLSQPLAHRDRCRERCGAGVGGAHDLQQLHDVRRTEEMQALRRLPDDSSTAAMRSRSRYEVFDARMVSGRTTLSRRRKRSIFTSMSSKTASSTRSASARSFRFPLGRTCARRRLASSSAMPPGRHRPFLDLAHPFQSALRARFILLDQRHRVARIDEACRDPDAHRAGADNADTPRSRAATPSSPGTLDASRSAKNKWRSAAASVPERSRWNVARSCANASAKGRRADAFTASIASAT